MNANEISNADLDAIISGNVPTVGEVIALARAELDRRAPSAEQKGRKVPEVRYWTHRFHDYLEIVAKTVDDKMVECSHRTGGEMEPEDVMIAACWQAIPAAEYEAAKANPEPVVVACPPFCADCGKLHHGNCCNTSEAKEHTHSPDCAISPMPSPPEEGYRYDLKALHDKLNEIIAAVNRLAKEGK